MDKFCAWALEAAGSGSHGDLVRLIAGGKTAAAQIEYVKKYGTALPTPMLVPEDDDDVMVAEAAAAAPVANDIQVPADIDQFPTTVTESSNSEPQLDGTKATSDEDKPPELVDQQAAKDDL